MKFYRTSNPDLISRKSKRPEKEILNEIGIFNVNFDKPKGYIRLFPEDFIVEEKRAGGEISRINDFRINSEIAKPDEKTNTLYANLIKIGIPTNVAAQRISEILEFPQTKIGTAGLKDSDAITSQLIAFPGIELGLGEIMARKIPNVYLSNFYYGKGSLNAGDLEGNIFTITVRTESEIDDKLKIKLNTIEQFGILNYFQSQRFGGMRLLSHELGKLIMQGNYEQAIKTFLFHTSSNDIPLLANIRKKAEDMGNDWAGIKKLFESEMPYTLFNEIRLLDYLIKNPTNFIGALIDLKDQTQLWAYAYSSLLFNKHLSEYSKVKGCVDEKFPIFLSSNPDDVKNYKKYLEQDGTLNFKKYLFPFKFLILKGKQLPGRIFPKDIKYNTFEKGIVIKFTLPKGAYATTFLTNLFELEQGLPISGWVNATETDPKKILGEGDIEGVRAIFKDYWYYKGQSENTTTTN